MNRINVTSFKTNCDFDYGEGWITFCWTTESGIDASLTIDLDGHCSREMPIRSGAGAAIVSVSPDSVALSFTPELAGKLELDTEIEMHGEMSNVVRDDLIRLASLI